MRHSASTCLAELSGTEEQISALTSRPHAAIAAFLSSVFEAESGNKARILSMEGLRGFAVLLVFLVHYYALYGHVLDPTEVHSTIARALASIGHSGVDLFFVLSGYLIYSAALRPALRFNDFIRRRAIRIYPVFLVVFIIYLGLATFEGTGRLPDDPARRVLYIAQNMALLPGILPIQPLITAAWSLSYEWFYYLTLPVVTIALRMHSWDPRRRLVLISIAASVFIALCFAPVIPKHPRLLMFIAGMLVYDLIRSGLFARYVSWLGERLAVAALPFGLGGSGVLMAATFPEDATVNFSLIYTARALLLCTVLLPLVLYCFRYNGFLNRVFSFAPLRYWGNMSYSYYLCHGALIHAAHRFIVPRSGVGYWLAMPVVCAITMAGSAVVFTLVEKPFSLRSSRRRALVAPDQQLRRAVAAD